MKILGVVVWWLLAVYCLLCIFIRKIRIPYLKVPGSRPGPFIYIGLAVFLWIPILTGWRIVPQAAMFLVHPLMIAALVFALVGYFVDLKRVL